MADDRALFGDQLLDAVVGQIEQRVQRVAVAWLPLSRTLHIDEPSFAGLDVVHIDFCARVVFLRAFVARGIMPYSAVTQPFPVLRRNGGTRSSTLAVQMTFVRPASIKTDPSA